MTSNTRVYNNKPTDSGYFFTDKGWKWFNSKLNSFTQDGNVIEILWYDPSEIYNGQ